MPKVPVLNYADMRETEQDLIDTLNNQGALTTRRLVQEVGPKMHWHRLIDCGVIREYQTVYGPVIAYTQRGREQIQDQAERYLPYLLGPGAIADRAYQMDAVRLLGDRGYRIDRVVYKTRNSKLPDRADEQETTDQISYLVMRQPEDEQRRLNALWPGFARPVNERIKPDMWGNYPEALGRPRLYASISGGGTSSGWIRTWFRKKSNALLISDWHCPLLVAVPDDQHLRSILRQNALKQLEARRMLEADRSWDPAWAVRMDYPDLELVILPLPTS